MQVLTGLNILLALATASNARPLKRTNEVEITFIGAANAQFTENFPIDGSTVSISNVLSISHISSPDANVQCTFNGIDHSVTNVDGAELVDVGPPQTQISGSCSATGSGSSTPPPSGGNQGGNGGNGGHGHDHSVEVVFIGAANAEFTQSFPVNGQWTQITNVLSISHIQLDNAGFTCTFDGIDHSVTTVTGAELVDVGPPQTQVSGSCRAI
ncbi:hypothetical protein N7466_007407 [Penicillium verhagenii]|uniref:uncharacterized protein n=1 Tax=Penicillium verhagenii TaxID=1562060 RepID=UPI002544D5CB|nr:uncharacterized protein N7466_007407 [Penicillium verhagenii]KAJ5928451.1 hypothetical protein N7466_007407 [Penicillium verhagenii]